MYRGTLTALATPMKDREVHLKGLRDLVELQISEGITGLVPCGTTGESASLSLEEQAQVIRAVVQQARGRVPVIAGAGGNSTGRAIQLSEMAREAGADGLLHVTPYYVKPTQEGLLAHFSALSEASNLPILLYNVPSRTGCDMVAETVVQAAGISKVVGIKEATGSIVRAQQILSSCPAGFAVLSGDDATALSLVGIGAAGVISVVSNVAPRATSEMIALALQGKMEQARQIHYRLLPLMDLLFIQSNPIPVKAALALMGYTENTVRLPLLPMGGAHLEQLSAEMKRNGILP